MILDDAGRCERFLKAPGNKNVPSMYQIIETCYLKSELGYYHKRLKLRATPRQLTNYDTAIDILLMVDESISDDPLLMKKIFLGSCKSSKWNTIHQFLANLAS